MAREVAGPEPTRLDQGLFRDPYRLYGVLRQNGPVQPVALPDGWQGWLVTSYEDARSLLADPRLSKDVTEAVKLLGPGYRGALASPLARVMLNADPPEHTRLRKLVARAFSTRAVAQLRHRIEQIADELLDATAGNSVIDLVTDYATPLPITVICELLGVPPSDRDIFRNWTAAFVAMTSEEEVAESTRHLTSYFTSLIAAKRDKPADDLLSRLIRVPDEDDHLTPSELLNAASHLLASGFESTLNLITNGTLALLRHPDQLALLRSDPSLLPGAIEEFLRYDSPVHIATLRFTTEPVRVGETEIPAGQFVHISLLAANRDGDHFPEPDRLDITRQAASHLAFGHGIHHCVGAPLARAEGEIAIGRLLSRFPDLALGCDPGSLLWRDSATMHGPQSLPVRIGAR
jgi:cytochrome P450